MLFSTAAFAVFMTVIFLAYWLLPHKYRWIFILMANAWFYISYDVRYLAVILVTMLASYICAILIEKQDVAKKKKIIMTTGVVVTLSLLLVFKYLNFALYTVAKVLNRLSIPMQETTLRLIMPVGISFYTFMAVGYIIDVYKGKTQAVRHFGKYAIFVSFFPNISSGPIERAGHFIPQIDKEKTFDYDSVVYGARLLLLGLIKKIVIADMMTKYVYAFKLSVYVSDCEIILPLKTNINIDKNFQFSNGGIHRVVCMDKKLYIYSSITPNNTKKMIKRSVEEINTYLKKIYK